MALTAKDSQQEKLPPPSEVPSSAVSREDEVREPLSGRDWFAISFAGVILMAILGISLFLLAAWRVPLPSLDALSADAQNGALERFKDLSTIVGERNEKIFDLLVTKALLPLLATLIGYLFGKRE